MDRRPGVLACYFQPTPINVYCGHYDRQELVDLSESLDYLYLNQVAQGVVTLDAASEAFRALPSSERSDTLHKLSLMVHEAHPLPAEITDAIATSGLKPTFTPCVMLMSGSFYKQLSRIARLPDDELDKAFALLMHLFRLADGRRRTSCGESCHHWWHQDLSDDSVIRELKSTGEA